MCKLYLHKFAICRIFNELSKESPLRTLTRVRDLEGRSCLDWANKRDLKKTAGSLKSVALYGYIRD